MSYRTYKEWKKKGRQVKQGEKAVGRLNDGTSLFSKKQTKKIKNITKTRSSDDYYRNDYSGYDQDYDYEYGYDIGLPGQW